MKPPLLTHSHMWQTTDMYIKKKNGVHRGAYVLERIPAGHLLLKLFLELFPCPDGLLVADILRKLLQACLGEILGEVLDTLLIGREQLLKEQSVRWSLHRMRRFQMKSRKFLSSHHRGQDWRKGTNHQSVVHADFSETGSNCIDVFFIYPGFEELYSKCCWNPCKRKKLI